MYSLVPVNRGTSEGAMVGEVRVTHSLPCGPQSRDFFGMCHEFSQLPVVGQPWADPGGWPVLKLLRIRGQNWQSTGWQLSGLPVNPVRYSGGERRIREDFLKGRIISWTLENGYELRQQGRDRPFQITAGNWERGEACLPQKHLGKDEPVVVRQCAHLFSEATQMSEHLSVLCLHWSWGYRGEWDAVCAPRGAGDLPGG